MMCGIVGIAGNIGKKEKNAFDDLLWVDTIRGSDGTGFATVSRNRVVNVLKEAGNAAYLRQLPEYGTVLGYDTQLLLGHNRAMTRGADDLEALKRDAQPFWAHHIVGVHNGHLSDRSWQALDGKIGITDSYSIIQCLAFWDPEWVIDRIEGDSALVWYNGFENTVNMWRNKQRPLYYVISKDRQTLVWASEVAMLYLTLNRNNIDFSSKDVMMLPVNTLVKFEIPKKRCPFEMPHTQKMPSARYFQHKLCPSGQCSIPKTELREIVSGIGTGLVENLNEQ